MSERQDAHQVIDLGNGRYELTDAETGKRAVVERMVKSQKHGRLEVLMICYPDDIPSHEDGVALFEEQVEAMREFIRVAERSRGNAD